MATLRPATRILSRTLFTPRPILRTAAPIPTLRLTSTPLRHKSEQNPVAPHNRPVPVPGPDAENLDNTVSKTDSGAYAKTPGEPDGPLSSGIQPTKSYTFEDIKSLSENPSPSRILIDVREPSEVLGTGSIPGAKNMPISSSPDDFFLPAEDFEDKYGFERPGKETEVVFYCKAGVRSNAAARLAAQAGFGGKIGEYPGSWVEWSAKGGKMERE